MILRELGFFSRCIGLSLCVGLVLRAELSNLDLEPLLNLALQSSKFIGIPSKDPLLGQESSSGKREKDVHEDEG